MGLNYLYDYKKARNREYFETSIVIYTNQGDWNITGFFSTKSSAHSFHSTDDFIHWDTQSMGDTFLCFSRVLSWNYAEIKYSLIIKPNSVDNI